MGTSFFLHGQLATHLEKDADVPLQSFASYPREMTTVRNRCDTFPTENDVGRPDNVACD